MAKATSLIQRVKPVGFGSGVVQMQPGSQSRGTFREWILSITLQGGCSYTLNNQTHQNQAGDMLLLERNTQQHWRVGGPEPWSVVYTIFEPRAHWVPWLDGILAGQPFRVTGAGTQTFMPAAQALKDVDALRRATHNPFSAELALNALERAILLIARSLVPSQSGSGALRAPDARIQTALAWAVDHLAGPISLADMAQASSTSRANFCRLFTRATGQPPMQYVERLKIQRAQELMATTGLPVKQIAGMVGFQDPKHFTRRFKSIMGLPPSAFKART
jgi:AraC-like DNA-binding protein/quercetin dioxygenase-like cupin family protein